MSVVKSFLNPQTFKEIRQWAQCDDPEDLANRIVYGLVSPEKLEESESLKKNKKRDQWIERIESLEGTATDSPPATGDSQMLLFGEDSDASSSKPLWKPTYEDLEKIAKACLTLDVFFLQEPEDLNLPKMPRMDFRKDPKENVSKHPECLSFIYRSLENQRWASRCFAQANPGYRVSFLDYDGDTPKPDHLLSPKQLLEASKDLVKKMKSDLGLNGLLNGLDWDQWHSKKIDDRFEELKRAIEKKNILVFTTFNRKDRIDLKVLKGFAVYDAVTPLIALNYGDGNIKKSPEKIFTLIHELAHLYVDSKNKDKDINYRSSFSSGLGLEDGLENEFIKNLEKFCNMVAEEFILPEKIFIKIWEEEKVDVSNSKKLAEALEKLSKKSFQEEPGHKINGISKWVFLYRAYHLEKIGKELFKQVRDQFFKASEKKRQEEKEKRDAKKEEVAKKEKVTKKENEQKNFRDTSKTLFKSNGRLFSRLAIANYLSSRLSSQTLKGMLGASNHADVLSLKDRVFYE